MTSAPSDADRGGAPAHGFAPGTLATRFSALVPEWPHARLAIALSGGADSAALLHACAALAAAEPALRVRALHVDHGLQAAATDLAAAALAVARRCGVPCAVLRVAVTESGEGLEAAARRARYAALAAALEPGECLVCAHHLEDQAETLLLQLLRGAGLPGLAAMPAGASLGPGRLLRPLLDVPRAALRAYAGDRALPFHDDPMNADPRHDRAWLRHSVWPAIVARWPAAAATLGRSAAHLAEAQALVARQAAADLAALAEPGAAGASLRVAPLLALDAPRRTAALRHWLGTRGLRSPPARRLALVERELLRARATTGPCLRWREGELHRYGDRLHAFAALPPPPVAAALGARAPLDLGVLGRLRLVADDGRGLAQARVALPLAARPRAGGERLRVAGGAPVTRALKDLLRESRVPPWVRERLVVLHDAGRVVAVVAPGRSWLAAEAAAGPGEAGWRVEWEDAPEALRAG